MQPDPGSALDNSMRPAKLKASQLQLHSTAHASEKKQPTCKNQHYTSKTQNHIDQETNKQKFILSNSLIIKPHPPPMHPRQLGYRKSSMHPKPSAQDNFSLALKIAEDRQEINCYFFASTQRQEIQFKSKVLNRCSSSQIQTISSPIHSYSYRTHIPNGKDHTKGYALQPTWALQAPRPLLMGFFFVWDSLFLLWRAMDFDYAAVVRCLTRLKSGSEAAASSVDIEVSYLRKPMHPLKGRLANPGPIAVVDTDLTPESISRIGQKYSLDGIDHDGLESVRPGNSVVDGCVDRALVDPRCEEPQTTRHTYREMLAMHDAACKWERAKRRRKAASLCPCNFFRDFGILWLSEVQIVADLHLPDEPASVDSAAWFMQMILFIGSKWFSRLWNRPY
ncbi:hypothetical protein Nepgr_022976 [Nepenthes gracilis]|uniref:Uncharacterized protein n=1 Tax=Nepenthes gracilis TaxID=150966 RepID=A0AAD3XYL3_NEPGR|nr:hypothetical protein Nepgr_022976 [Nepenthes gracilis]